MILLGCSLAFLPLGGQLLDISGEGLQAHTPSPTSGSEQTVTQLPGRASNHAGSCGNISPSSLKGLSISGYCEHSKGTAGAGAMGFRDYPRKCLELRGLHGASLVAQMVESACSSLGSIPGWEVPLEEGMATHSSILAWRIPWTEEPGRLQSMGL